jgi:hypothetical protein
MAMAAQLAGLAEGQPWFWASATSVALLLLLLNFLIIVAVHARRLRESARGRRKKRFRARIEESLAELEASRPASASPGGGAGGRASAPRAGPRRRVRPGARGRRRGVRQVGGDIVPETLGRATRDDQPAVRRVAAEALGSFDDPRAVELAAATLVDPDLLQAERDWPVERAQTLASLGAV